MIKISILRIGLLMPNLLEVMFKILQKNGFIPEELGLVVTPDFAFDQVRRQYRADLLIEEVDRKIKSQNKIIGVCDNDLFLPVFTHLYGFAPLNGDSGIVSISRLKSFGINGRKVDLNLTAERGVKEIIHELGHLIGLKHCRVSWCVMHTSLEPEEIDTKDFSYCEICQKIIIEGGKNEI